MVPLSNKLEQSSESLPTDKGPKLEAKHHYCTKVINKKSFQEHSRIDEVSRHSQRECTYFEGRQKMTRRQAKPPRINLFDNNCLLKTIIIQFWISEG